jgi:hypothetical protein
VALEKLATGKIGGWKNWRLEKLATERKFF